MSRNSRSKSAFSSLAMATVLALGISGCGGSSTSGTTQGSGSEQKAVPVFSLAWSEYPSWSVFGVAHTSKLINGKAGELGPIEKKWGVDIELKEADYDTCLNLYGTGNVDAVCITNMDVLSPSLSLPTNVILPTSTSVGADALLVGPSIKKVEDLKGKKVYGLSKSVSEYTFVRNLEILGQKETEYKFAHMDPAAAATAMQQKQAGYEAIVVWNPFVMETLKKRSDVKVLFDSTKIPGEIIDSVAMSRKSLQKPGGKAFASAVVDAFYQVNRMIEDKATRDDTLVALGEKFSNLDLAGMKQVVEQTRFYSTPAQGIEVVRGKALAPIMKKVIDFSVAHDMVKQAPVVEVIQAGGASKANVLFDDTFLKEVQGKAN